MSTYKIDPSHSDITFKVKHLMITNTTGNFSTFDASMQSEKDDFSDATITFSADTASITTGSEQRDGHLKSNDFFNAEQYPKLSFVSKEFKPLTDGDYKLTGDLTIRDVTKPIELTVTYNGTVTDPYGQVKSGFEIEGKINRQEYGLTWSGVTEAGGLVVSNDVKLHLNVQMVKQA